MPPAATPSGPVVLVCGDDDFNVKQRAKLLFQQWTADTGGFDQETIDAAVPNSGEALGALARLRESLQTLPFFGTKVVWFQHCTFLGDDRTGSSSAVTAALAELSAELKAFKWDNVRLLISAPKVDKRKTFYKTIEKIGAVETFNAWSLEDKNWMLEAETVAVKAFRDRRKRVADDALAELIPAVGPHPQVLLSEIEKACLFVGERPEVTFDDINAIVTRNKQARAFALAEALASRDLPKVLSTLDDELWELQFDRQRSAIGLLYGLISKVRSLILVQEMLRQGWLKEGLDYNSFKARLDRVPADALPADRRFNPLAQHPFVLYKSAAQAKNFTSAELVRAMELLLACNQRLVSSALDESLILQQTLVEIVRRDPESSPAPVASRRPAAVAQ
jgi:DNA polymerase-3 subunit delta